jgi:hypothetical protein
MIAWVLAVLVAPFTAVPAPTARSGNPFDVDKLLLLQAGRACHVHDGAVYFIQHSRLDAPAIHTTKALGDTDAQITCVLQRLPADFIARYRVDAEVTPQQPNGREVAPDHQRRVLTR